MVTPYRPKPPRNRVAMSTRDLVRRMRKRLNKTTEGMEVAVAKVKNNAAIATKELEVKPDLMEEGSHGFSLDSGAAIRFVKLGGSMKWRSANGSRP